MITIVGAGMAGLLAGCMIRDHIIYEAQSCLPNNHHAVLRFRSSVVGDTLNIPFKQVKMMKCVHPYINPVADQLAYSLKTNGTARLRSAISADGEISERYIAPPDLISRMASMCNVYLEQKVSMFGLGNPAISTIPMPMLMEALHWDGPGVDFKSRDGWVLTYQLAKVDVYCTVYDPNPSSPIGRVSITGDLLQAELIEECDESSALNRAISILGLSGQDVWNGNAQPKIVKQRYAKILPIDETVRKRFIMWASEEHRVYSLGRFATWRPGLLLDDVVNDVRVIQRLINGGSSYHHKLR